jgi:cyclase
MGYRHFSIQELSEGVFAAIHQEGGAAYSNAGIIDLGGQTLVFDTFDMAVAAKELLAACEDLTGRRPAWVVNSHKHGDHWGGNQVFDGQAVILSTHQTRSGMLNWGAEIERMKNNSAEVEGRIKELEDKLRNEKDTLQRAVIERNLNRNRFLLADLPDFRFCPPTVTFEGTMVFRGEKRTIELVATGPGHTPEECHLVLREDKVIFTGDLAFFGCPPFMAPDCSLVGWLGKLDEFQKSDIKVFVPGHGGVGNNGDLQREQDYICVMRDLVAEAVQKKRLLEDVLKMRLPKEFEDWEVYIARNENNLRTLYGQMIGKT